MPKIVYMLGQYGYDGIDIDYGVYLNKDNAEKQLEKINKDNLNQLWEIIELDVYE